MLSWPLCSYNSQQSRHMNSDLWELLSFIGSGIVFRLIQPFKHTVWTLDGTSSKDSSIVQSSKTSFSSPESWFMLLGRLTKLFRLRSKDFNEDKQPISSGSALKLQARKPSKDNTARFFKRTMDACSCHIEVPLTSNSSTLSTFSKFPGIFLSSEQPDRSSFLRDFKHSMLLEMLSSFLQLFMLNTSKPIIWRIDGDSSAIPVLSKQSFIKQFMFPTISGKFSSFEQPSRVKNLSDSISRLLGRILILRQFIRFTYWSFLWRPSDGWTSDKLIQPSRIRLSRLGIPVRSGDLDRYSELLRLMIFNLTALCNQAGKKKYGWYYHTYIGKQ